MRGYLKRCLAVFLAGTFLFLVPGCSQGSSDPLNTKNNIMAPILQSDREIKTTPVKKDGNKKWRVGFMEVEPFLLFGTLFYDFFETLKSSGWITYDTLPFDRDKCSALDIVKWAANRDLGEYLEFDGDLAFYLNTEGADKVKTVLEDRLAIKKDIDLMIAMGTEPGRIASSIDHNVNTLVFGAGNAVTSKIVQSVEDSGKDHLLGHLDPTRFKRQISVLYNIFKFNRLGMVFEDEPVTRSFVSLDDYNAVAGEKGFQIVIRNLAKPKSDDAAAWDQYYQSLKEEYVKLIREDRVDAYLLNTAVIPHNEKISSILQPFYEAKIPVFSQEGAIPVKYGCLMTVNTIDTKGYAHYMTDCLSKVFNGAKPRDLEQVFVSTPYLAVNMEVAEKIGFVPQADMLLSCDQIFLQTSK